MWPPWFSMMRRQIESPMPRPAARDEKNGSKMLDKPVGEDAMPAIADSDHDVTGVGVRCEVDDPPLGRRRLHRMHRVDEQVHEHLLQLDPGAVNARQHVGQSRPQFDLLADQFGMHQLQDFLHEFVESNTLRARTGVC